MYKYLLQTTAVTTYLDKAEAGCTVFLVVNIGLDTDLMAKTH